MHRIAWKTPCESVWPGEVSPKELKQLWLNDCVPVSLLNERVRACGLQAGDGTS